MGPTLCPPLFVLTQAAPHRRRHGAWCIASGPAARDPVPGAGRCLGGRCGVTKIQGETNKWRSDGKSVGIVWRLRFILNWEYVGNKRRSAKKDGCLWKTYPHGNLLYKNTIVCQYYLISPQIQIEMLWDSFSEDCLLMGKAEIFIKSTRISSNKK